MEIIKQHGSISYFLVKYYFRNQIASRLNRPQAKNPFHRHWWHRHEWFGKNSFAKEFPS